MNTDTMDQMQIVDTMISNPYPSTQHPLYMNQFNGIPPTGYPLINTTTADLPTQTMDTLIDPAYSDSIIQFDPLYSASQTTDYTKQEKENADNRIRQLSNSSVSSAEKTYSFVAIPGVNQKKRPRRRYDEVERLYHCNWYDCRKSYGTLNHLNAHITMQKHGNKRHPNEFKEMRKEWRRQKKERESRKHEIDSMKEMKPCSDMSNPEILSTYPQIYAQPSLYGSASFNDFY
ncbi:hypothetical protein BDB01DRAFT_792205 [Pilobolus umbonatus]|nr:hypothetical protein BDB01DRAFT_792205 [Pilobolus umbonatus]